MKRESLLVAFWLCLVASSSAAKTQEPFDEQCRSAREIVVATLTDVERRICVWTDSLETERRLHIRDYVFHRGILVVEKNLKGGSVTIEVTWGTIEPRGNTPGGPHGQEFESGQRGIWLIWEGMKECEMLPRVSFENLDRLAEVDKAFEESDTVIIEPLVVTGEKTSGLKPLILDGQELHASLVTSQIDDAPVHVSRGVLQSNPQLSTDAEFVQTIARSGSQGRLDGEGIRAALYAFYDGEGVVGIYGLETASTAEADRREELVRGIWAKNASLDRARVHRGGNVIVVVWTDGVSASCWEEVNAVVAERLAAP